MDSITPRSEGWEQGGIGGVILLNLLLNAPRRV